LGFLPAVSVEFSHPCAGESITVTSLLQKASIRLDGRSLSDE